MKIYAKVIDDITLQQAKEIQSYFPDSNIVLMPDVHGGKDTLVGLTMTLTDRVSPYLIGNDIGCGMTTYVIDKNVDLKQHLDLLDKIIHNYIPAGRNIHESEYVYGRILRGSDYIKSSLRFLNTPLTNEQIKNVYKSLGTLGSGNHFIELGEGKDNYYLTVHSGSRGLGALIFKYWSERAKQWYAKTRKDNIKSQIDIIPKQDREKWIKNFYDNTNIPKQYMCLVGIDMEEYLCDITIAKNYAKENREIILQTIYRELKKSIPELKAYSIKESIHNYVEDNILRKGAIYGYHTNCIIPLNMRDGIVFGFGKSGKDWNWSLPHGAGRVMSRKEAFNKITLDEFKESMKDVYSSCVYENTIDESPMAYKNKDDILDLIKNRVDIYDIAKPIYNFKGI